MNIQKERSEIPVHCSVDEMRDVVAMVPHPRNPNRHPDSQIDLLGRVIRNQGRRNPIVVSKRSGFIVSGHGRLAAAEKIAAQVVPVDLQEFETEADELAHLAADNRIAELAEMDQDQLGELLTELEGIEDIDFELSGFERASLDDLLGDTDDERQSPGLVAEFGADPFTVMDARTGRWQERKRAWLGRGLVSADGRNENLAFALSSQPEEVYARKNKEEKKAGAKMSWEEFAEKFPEAIVQKGTSIFDPVLTELNEAIRITPAGSLPMRVRKQFEGSRKLGKSHQNVLVFCKGDPKEVAGRCTLASILDEEQEEG